MKKNKRRIAFACLLALCTASAWAADLNVRLDAREVARKHVHTDLSLAVKPGSLTLVFPKWIPGEHGPTGPLDSMIGLEVRANGKPLAWSRDPLDMFSLTLTVPRGTDHLDIALDSGLATEGDGFTAAPTSSAQLAVLPWNEFVLLPKGRDAGTITAVAAVVPPAGWNVACALEAHTLPDGAVQFEQASLARLIDSPVQMGRFTERVELPGSAPLPALRHSIAIAADSAAALKLPDGFAAGYGKLVAEAGALFGTRMYRHYTWLLTLSDHVAHFGLEHHESSDNRREENVLSEPPLREGLAELLGHEYVHSWNGKYRRPLGLVSPDYQKPMDDSLLWVYEGLTQFWGDVLPTRAGLIPAQSFREILAHDVGNFDIEPGARWRPLADTAVAAQRLYDAPHAWRMSRRDTDFYEASVLLWLDVDAELRARTHDHASLDDFMRSFYSGASGAPALKPYVEQDIYAALARIAPGDWRTLIRRHLDTLGPGVLLAALERSGWKLGYSPEKNTWVEYYEKRMKTTERAWSIGLRLDDKGAIIDAVEDRAAALAGAGPGMTLIAVNGKKYTPEVLDAAILEAQSNHKPIALLVQSDDYYRTLSAEYFDGPRFPHLVRIPEQADTLSEVLKSRLQ